MDRGRDGLALITRDRHTGFAAIWSDIKAWCADSDTAFALAKINASEKHKKVLTSVRGPSAATGTLSDDSETIPMIRALHVLPVDFQIEPSLTEHDAIAHCRAIVASGKSDDAKNLWQALLQRAEKSRLGGGTIPLQELWADLRARFSLAQHPDFAASWRALAAITTDYVGRIETGLPNGASFTRKQHVDDLTRIVNDATVSVIYGNSGTGKSALVKSALESRFPDDESIEMFEANLSRNLYTLWNRMASGS
jgi:hypothetical protein